MELESYKVQFKISKKDFPKLKDAGLQYQAVKNMINNGSAIISLLEMTDDYFDYPEGTGNYPDWNSKMNIDLLFEFEMLLTLEQASNEKHIREQALRFIEMANAFDYIYEDEDGRHISFCSVDVPENCTLTDKEWEKELKKEEKEKKQLDLFKKGKSK